ncbi:hypothetical protein BH23BAC4_BH23BAC4_16720 [soil metagenome]
MSGIWDLGLTIVGGAWELEIVDCRRLIINILSSGKAANFKIGVDPG